MTSQNATIQQRYQTHLDALDRAYVNSPETIGAEHGMSKDAVVRILRGEYKGVRYPQFDAEGQRPRYEQYLKDIAIAKAHSKAELLRKYRMSSDTLNRILAETPDEVATPVHRFLTMALTYNPQPGWYY